MLADLPYSIQLRIIQNLNRTDAYHLAATCRSWFSFYQSPVVWRHLILSFNHASFDSLKVDIVAKYGGHVQSLTLELDQSDAENRRLAVTVIDTFAQLPTRQLEKFAVKFTGENPLFYGGQEFNLALHSLFGSSAQGTEVRNQLKLVDLEQLNIMQTDEIFYALSANHPQLRYLNIQNKQLVCRVHSDCIRTLVDRCRDLEDLRLFHSSLADEILLDLAEAGRAPLRHLSLFCRRQDKFSADLSPGAWQQLSTALPQLQVTLKFDHTCALPIMSGIMKPQIPVVDLQFETYTKVVAKLKLTHRYSATLQRLWIQSQPSREFEAALMQLAEAAPNLRSIRVMCGVTEETIEQLYRIRPSLVPADCEFHSDLSEQPGMGDAVWDEIRDDWK